MSRCVGLSASLMQGPRLHAVHRTGVLPSSRPALPGLLSSSACIGSALAPFKRTALTPPGATCNPLAANNKLRRVAAEARQGQPPTPATGAYIGKLGSDSAAVRTAAGGAVGGGASAGDARRTQAAAGVIPKSLQQKQLTPGQVFLPLALAVLLPVLGGVAMSTVANPLQAWYQDLRKPSWEPPEWVFGPVWSALYILMGLASFLVWADGSWAKQGDSLRLYAVQLALNYLWPVVFFRAHKILTGAVILGALVFLVNATMRAFYAVNRVAGWLLLPYQAWVVYALVLNIAIWRLNRGTDDSMPGATWSATPRGGEW